MKRKLTRSRTDSKLAGVCGGLAKYLNIDVVIIRALWVLSAFIGGPSIGVYIICAIVIPKESISDRYDREETVDNRSNENHNETYEESSYDKDDSRYDESDPYDVPYDETRDNPYEEEEEKREFNIAYIGIGLIGLGAFLAFKVIFPAFEYKFLWPVILIVGGLLLLSKNNDSKENE